MDDRISRGKGDGTVVNRAAEVEPQIKRGVDAVRSVYRELDARPINRNCVMRRECCHFQLTGRTPHLTRGEAFTVAKALRATGRTRMPSRLDGCCPFLNAATGKCMIYTDRPFGCRTHFCSAAGGPYARHEVADLVQRLEQIDRDLGGDGAHLMQNALEEALEYLR